MVDLKTKTVLIVDDDISVLRMVEKTLSRYGCRLLSATTGEEAVELADSTGSGIDLLLTDMMMPGMNGKELAEIFLNEYPETKVMVMSSFMCPSISSHEVSDNEKIFIQKPFTPDSLISKMKSVLDS